MRVNLILLSLLFSSFTFAHKDTSIKLAKEGQLKGLPKEYSLAFFTIKNSTLTIANNKLVLPECISKYLVKNTLSFSSSWYHTRSSLPPYLNIRATSNTENIKYTFMFNMNTLELIQAYSLPKYTNVAGVSYSLEPINLSESCIQNIKSIR